MQETRVDVSLAAPFTAMISGKLIQQHTLLLFQKYIDTELRFPLSQKQATTCNLSLWAAY